MKTITILPELPKCNCCGVVLTKENYSGWYDIGETPLGITVNVPICNECNVSDDGSERNGAY